MEFQLKCQENMRNKIIKCDVLLRKNMTPGNYLMHLSQYKLLYIYFHSH